MSKFAYLVFFIIGITFCYAENCPANKPQRDEFRVNNTGNPLTTNQGLPYADDEHSLRVGGDGPTLLEDFIYREKISHFDHERIPERAVHARGAAAHGYFQVYESMAPYTKAKFLQDPSKKTPVFVRFSNVAGSKGSADTVRDVRGFAVKFYTDEGNYDFVGNNIPVFFIQDAIKFPDLVHAVRPEPRTEIPQAASAHNTFWDFVSLETESAHMLMWQMSDRTLPQLWAMMEGFGVHTFRFINAEGQSHYVKLFWKPVLGVNSFVWDEAQKINGKDPDFHRRQLYTAIDKGQFPTWEFGVQLFTDKDADKFDFDILDATKIIPEELVPVKIIGRLVLDRNVDNFFAETEQVAFCLSHVVPGIDFTNDPLLQGRLFSYLDTQITRLGGPNFHELPINRPKCMYSNNQRDGMHRMRIDVDETAYNKNSINKAWPKPLSVEQGGFASYPDRVNGAKSRTLSKKFDDHFSQAKLFWNSMSNIEKQHIIDAFSFELTKVTMVPIRKRVIARILSNINDELATKVATNLGLILSRGQQARAVESDEEVNVNNLSDTPSNACAASDNCEQIRAAVSPTLSQLNPANRGPLSDLTGRKIAILAADGVDANVVEEIKRALYAAKAIAVEVVSLRLGNLAGENGVVKVDETFTSTSSVLYQAVIVPSGAGSVEVLLKAGDAVHFIAEAYKHSKPIAAIGDGDKLLEAAGVKQVDAVEEQGVIVGDSTRVNNVLTQFIVAISKHRFWNRLGLSRIDA